MNRLTSRTSLSKLVTAALRDGHLSSAEASVLEARALKNGKVSKSEAAQLRRALQASTFDAGVEARLTRLTGPAAEKPMTVAQAVAAAGALGRYLDGFRASVRALGADMDDPATFERVMSERFGPGKSLDPFPDAEARGLLTLTPIWPGVAPYPRLRVDPATGQLYLNDASRSPKWFGPHTPPAAARVRGTFPAENDRFDVYEAFVAGERS